MVMEFLSLKNFYDSVVNGLYEIRNTHKTNTSLKCKIKYVYGNHNIETYWGFTDAGNRFLFCPILMILKLNPIFYNDNGVKTIYVSACNENSLDILKLSEIPDAIKQHAVISWKYLRTWESMKVENISGTIDLNLFDNEYAQAFSNLSFQIMSTKIMEFLNEVPRRVFILSCIISGLIGGFIFSFITAIIFVIIFVITYMGKVQ